MCILLSHLCIFLPIYLQVIISNINSSKIGSLHSSSVRLFLYFPFSLTDRGDNSLTSISHKVVILCKLLPYTVLISFLYSLANILIVLGKMTLYSIICITQWHLNSKLHKFFWGNLYIYILYPYWKQYQIALCRQQFFIMGIFAPMSLISLQHNNRYPDI